MTRTGDIARQTKETDVRLTLALDGTGAGERRTGVGFLDHMLDLLARHGRLDLDVAVTGDLETGAPPHRRGHRHLPGPGARRRRSATAAGSPATATRPSRWTRRAPPARSTSPAGPTAPSRPTCRPATIAGFDHELAEEFFRAVATNARLTLHVIVESGTNAHHMIEAAFKAFARALRAATALDPTETGVPSTKGTLT